MIIILGCAGAGKSTIERSLVDNYGYERIISYTTRPIRKNEKQHVDYHFISDEDFQEKKKSGFFGETTTYNGWNYGIAVQDMNSNAIAVVEPFGARQIKKIAKEIGFKTLSFFIDVSENERIARMAKRGDNTMELFRRVISDQGLFQGISWEVDHIICNENRDVENTVAEIDEKIKATV